MSTGLLRGQTGEAAPDGDRYAVFTNADPGRGCLALQGFAVDGRQVASIRLSLTVKGKDIGQDPARRQWPYVVVTFYDEHRAEVKHDGVGPFMGTFDWRREQKALPVPTKAREAILRIGLLGGTGELSLDDVRIE